MRVLVNKSSLQGVGNAIRDKTGEERKYTLAEMADAIRSISTGVDMASIADGSYDWGNYKGTEAEIVMSIYLKQPTLISYTNNNLKAIKIEKAFDSNVNMTSFIAPNLETLSGKISAFGTCSKLIDVNLGKAKEIPNNTFWGCNKLPYVPNADILTYIGREAFRYNETIESIDLPKCEKTEGYAFTYMTALRHINLPSIKVVMRNLFSFSHNLETLDIGSQCTFIDCYVCFDSKCQLNLIVRKVEPPELNGPFFFASGGTIKSIKVPAESIEAYKSAQNWSRYADIITAI